MYASLSLLKQCIAVCLFTAAILLSGCAINMQVPLKEPVTSAAKYDQSGTTAPVVLQFSDARSDENKAAVLVGRIPMRLTVDDKPFDPFSWLVTHTVKEMVSRGLPIQLGGDGKGPPAVNIRLFRIENHRVSGFSPFETYTSLSSDVITSSGTQRIVVFIKRGKVPVWSFNEVIDPTYNDAIDLVAKEFAAKLSRILFNAKLGDGQIDTLIEKTSGESINFRDVHELGFGNNPRAIPQLVKLTTQRDDEIFHAARSSLGVLRAHQHLELLKKQAEEPNIDWEDRAITLKAIGDLGTPEARAYLQQERSRLEKLADTPSVRIRALLALYLD